MNKNLFAILLITLSGQLSAQNIDSLQSSFGQNKIIISEYRLPILIALSHYPELINIKIIFKSVNIESTGKTTIAFPSILTKSNRKYIIYINDNKEQTGFLFKDLSLNEQIAVIGHELAHVLDFSKRSFIGMITWGSNYLNHEKRIKIERETDQATITHGLKNELYEWSNFALTSPLTNPQYKKMRFTYYLHPEEISK